MELFDQQIIPLELSLGRTANLYFWPNWLAEAEADALLAQSIAEIPWRGDTLLIAGKEIPMPRLHCWYGTSRQQSAQAVAQESPYNWSGVSMRSIPFPPWLDTVRLQVEQQSGERFNRVLANYYRDGNDSVDWHSDDEPVLGPAPVIASVSLGAERVFNFRHRMPGANGKRKRFDLVLPHGSLLVMAPGMQRYWHHRIAKVKGITEPRVNFTFRMIQPPQNR